MTQNENLLFCCHFETVQIFFPEYFNDIWCRNNLQILVGNGVLRGVYALTEVRGTLRS